MKTQTKQVGPYLVQELKHPDPEAKTAVLSCRLSGELHRRMLAACDSEPYRISISALVHRGIELAIQELTGIRKMAEERHEKRIELVLKELEALRVSFKDKTR